MLNDIEMLTLFEEFTKFTSQYSTTSQFSSFRRSSDVPATSYFFWYSLSEDDNPASRNPLSSINFNWISLRREDASLGDEGTVLWGNHWSHPSWLSTLPQACKVFHLLDPHLHSTHPLQTPVMLLLHQWHLLWSKNEHHFVNVTIFWLLPPKSQSSLYWSSIARTTFTFKAIAAN